MDKTARISLEKVGGLTARTVARDTPSNAWPTDAPPLVEGGFRAGAEEVERVVRTEGCAIVMLPTELDDHELTVATWNLVSAVYKPVSQYESGELVFPVEVRPGESGSSHYSASKAAGGFHTDGSLMAQPPAVGVLLCLSPADSGGETILVEAELIRRAVAAADPAFPELLGQLQPFAAEDDVRDVRQWAPVLSTRDSGVGLRYLRRYLVAGWERTDRAIPDGLTDAFDVIDKVAGDPEAQRPHALQRGEVLFWRNSRYVHGRRAFEEREQRRRLVRIYGADDPDRLACQAD
ncbi:TauD/TfdA family dioxygenase [Streptomyces sp. HC307]|uniref:TauD/TfdA family dioxygenase n=1 Tax=Streptomyces flavusporus TaxID=3385496 RepID=UPI00391766E7